MSKSYWQEYLTDADTALFRMLSSLMETEISPKHLDARSYMLPVPYCGKDPEYLSAVIDAVRGRLGERMEDVVDDAEVGVLIFYVKFDRE